MDRNNAADNADNRPGYQLLLRNDRPKPSPTFLAKQDNQAMIQLKCTKMQKSVGIHGKFWLYFKRKIDDQEQLQINKSRKSLDIKARNIPPFLSSFVV